MNNRGWALVMKNERDRVREAYYRVMAENDELTTALLLQNQQNSELADMLNEANRRCDELAGEYGDQYPEGKPLMVVFGHDDPFTITGARMRFRIAEDKRNADGS